jgi:hypothetical protein
MDVDLKDWIDIFEQLCLAKREYDDTVTEYPSIKDFVQWMDVNYGITLIRDRERPDLGLRPLFSIADKQKYLIFMLKFTHE